MDKPIYVDEKGRESVLGSLFGSGAYGAIFELERVGDLRDGRLLVGKRLAVKVFADTHEKDNEWPILQARSSARNDRDDEASALNYAEGLRGHAPLYGGKGVVRYDGVEHPAFLMEFFPSCQTVMTGVSRGYFAGGTGKVLSASRIVSDIAPLLSEVFALLAERGIVHREPHYKNILAFFDNQGAIEKFVLIDFGMARKTSRLTPTPPIQRKKTCYWFCSPEAYWSEGYRNVDQDTIDRWRQSPKMDVWSLGALLYYIAYGKAPYADEIDRASWSIADDAAFQEELVRIKCGPLTFPQIDGGADKGGESERDAADALNAVIAECLAPDPRNRPTAREVYGEICLKADFLTKLHRQEEERKRREGESRARYGCALEAMRAASDESAYLDAAALFDGLGGYGDSSEQARRCRKNAKRCQVSERNEAARQKRREARSLRAIRLKKGLSFSLSLAFCVAVLAAIAVAIYKYPVIENRVTETYHSIVDPINYSIASSYYEDGEYKKAANGFGDLGNYADSEKRLVEAMNAYVDEHYNNDDETTFSYLSRLRELGYDVDDRYDDLYAWRIEEALINGSASNHESHAEYVSHANGWYVHFLIEGGTPGEELAVYTVRTTIPLAESIPKWSGSYQNDEKSEYAVEGGEWIDSARWSFSGSSSNGSSSKSGQTDTKWVMAVFNAETNEFLGAVSAAIS